MPICGECESWVVGMRRCMNGSPLILDDDTEACSDFAKRKEPRIFEVRFWNRSWRVMDTVEAGSIRDATIKVWNRCKRGFEKSKPGEQIQSSIIERRG